MIVEMFSLESFQGLTKELVEHGPVLLVRTVTVFITVLAVVRWTGKRTVAKMAPWDLALLILLGEVAAVPVGDLHVHILQGVIPVVLVGALHVLLTTLTMHSRRFEQLTEGTPTVLVKDGEILKPNLLRERVSLIDLKAALRHEGVTDLSEVREALLEPAGGLSIILREPRETVTREDLHNAVEQIIQANSERMRTELRELLRRRNQS